MTEDDFNNALTTLVAESDGYWRTKEQRQRIPREVFHYTSGQAFHAIIKSARLWATVSTELNDLTELKHAADALRNTLVRHRDVAELPQFRVLYPLQVTHFDYERADMSSVFIASLSEAEDDLTQWSMYADRFEGIALGFDAAALAALDAANHTDQAIGFFRVSYDAEKNAKFWEWFVSRWEKEAAVGLTRHLARAADPLMHVASWFGNLAMAALTILPRMKSAYFSSEREWRLAHMHFPEHVECAVVVGEGFKTHVELDLGQIAGQIPLTSVWLGPAVSNDRSEARVRDVLAARGFEHVQVRRSRIPLRGEAKEIRL